MSQVASVIICTHNPRADVLARTLAALRAQTLPLARWELVIVDNASSSALRKGLDVSWHPKGRIMEEPEPGANPARQCGLRASRGALLVLVDDDNVLEPDYLATALAIAERWPVLGAFGGSNLGEYEQPAPDWLMPYLSILAIREVTKELWTNAESDRSPLPFGAGMCFRRSVADRYLQDVAIQPLKRCLGRRGDYDISGEDPDIACTAFDVGLGVGLFPTLRLRHFMPAVRLTERQVLRVARGNMAAMVVLQYIRGRLVRSRFTPFGRFRALLHVWRKSGFEQRISRACLQGEVAAFWTLMQWENGLISTPEEYRTAFIDKVQRRLC